MRVVSKLKGVKIACLLGLQSEIGGCISKYLCLNIIAII